MLPKYPSISSVVFLMPGPLIGLGLMTKTIMHNNLADMSESPESSHSQPLADVETVEPPRSRPPIKELYYKS